MAKKSISIILLVLSVFLFSSCNKEIWNEIDSLKDKVAALQTAQNAFENHLFVTTVSNSGEKYTIAFSDGTSVTITNGKDGKDGKDGDTIIESITVSDQGVTFNLSDGTSFTVPLYAAISVKFDFDESGAVPNSTMDVSYTVSSNLSPVTVEVLSSSDIQAKAIPGVDGKKGAIQIKFSSVIDEYSKVVVFASNGEKMVMHTLHFEEGGLVVSSANTLSFSAEGGSEEISFLTNMGYDIIVPDEVKDWISTTATKAMSEHNVCVTVKANNTYDNRSAIIQIKAKGANLMESITIYQSAATGLFLTNSMAFTTNGASDCAIDIMANTKYNIVIPETASWIHTAVATKSLMPSSAMLHIDQNNGDSFRQAEVGIVSESGQKEAYTVTQFGTHFSLLKISHGAPSLSFTEISADSDGKDVDLAGIIWGDGKQELYAKGISHTYEKYEIREVEILSTPVYSVTITDINGIKSIDVSNL